MGPEPVALQTTRLTLEPKRAEHAEPMWDAIEASLPQLTRWMSWAGSSTPETVRAHTEEAEAAWNSADGDAWEFVMFEDGAVVGSLGLTRYNSWWKTCNFGYWVRSDRAGNGLATEASAAVIDFGFTSCELHRIELVAEPDNKASCRVAEKLGFIREGLMRHGTWAGGEPRDVNLYGLLSTDPRLRPE